MKKLLGVVAGACLLLQSVFAQSALYKGKGGEASVKSLMVTTGSSHRLFCKAQPDL